MLSLMLYKDDVKRGLPAQNLAQAERPPNYEEFRQCLQKALRILEEQHKV